MPSRPATGANGHHRPPLPPPLSNSSRHQNYNQHYYSASSYPSYSATSSSSSPSIKGCICCLFLLFSLLALLAIAVVLVVLLAVKPKKPQFDLQQVSVQYVGISSNPAASAATAAASSASLSLNIRLLFRASNPNKIGIKYDESRFTVMYRGIPLGEGIVPGFYQPAHSVRQVETIISVDRVNLQQADATDLVRDASLNDRVEFRVLGEVRANVRIMSFDSPGVQVSVDCAVVISPLKKAVTYKQCGFDGLNF